MTQGTSDDLPFDGLDFAAALNPDNWKETSSVGWNRTVGDGQLLLIRVPGTDGIMICGMPARAGETRPSVFVPLSQVAALRAALEDLPK